MRLNRTTSLRYLYNYVIYNKHKVKLYLKENLIFCGMAGRVCYSPFLDWVDERLNSDLLDYLERLSKWTHYSVFAHAPVEVKVNKDDFMKLLFYNLFKVYYDETNEIMYINLRHILEAYNTANRGNIKEVVKDFYRYIDNFDEFNYRTIQDLNYKKVGNVYYFKVNNYWDFYYIESIDRVSSHQLVRHTVLNFNQQSQRYVKLNNITIPSIVLNNLKEKYSENLLEEYTNGYLNGLKHYYFLTKEGMASEDARGVLPQTSSTNLVVSGFSSDIDKFIKDRTDVKAQSYIRTIAEQMRSARELF